ncbi:MAG: ABC transporter substrate-binding protein [Treponema sp.]|nr:ABC transporter substrate-binding protein [Treponema sp.]
MKVKQTTRFLLILVFLAALTGSLWANGSNQQTAAKPVELVWAFATWGVTPPDITKVETAISNYLEPKIGVRVKLLPMGVADRNQKLTLMMASPSEQLDLVYLGATLYQSGLTKGQLVPLNDLLATRGQGIIQTVGNTYLLAGQKDGVQYGIPSIRDMASGLGFLITKDYVAKYNLDISSIKKLEDITPILATIKKNEPNFYPLSMNVGFEVTRSIDYDPLSDNFGVLMSDNPNKVVNFFASQEYRDRIALYRSWYQAGYISPDAAASTETAVSVMKAGKACAQFTANKPGIVTENELSTGRKLDFADITTAVLTTGGVQGVIWGIANNTINAEKSMDLLNLLFIDPTLINLINYGIEGEHYVKNADGTINFPAGIDATNSKYNLGGMDWQLGNSYLAYPWEGKPADLAAQMKAYNDRSIVSPAYGFEFDNTNVRPQIAALTAVADQYRKALETGSVDLSVLDEFNSRLNAAGLADVIAEKQKQYDAWRAGRN